MIKTSEVIEFFDRLAPGWDAEMIRHEDVIERILDNEDISEGKDVMDVACGTGVLIRDYLDRRVSSVTAVDISPKMAEIAGSKFSDPRVTVLCGDAEEIVSDRRFDRIVVYNAFPHFPDPERLIRKLASGLRPGGMLTIAHGMSRERIEAHHRGRAAHVSNGLMPVEELGEIMQRYLRVTTLISDEKMYQAVGKRTG